ncbi:DUF996 domain-containing protein [Marinitoga aeolica]|uniref:DUF996 domain-containing protein n=1 Tax=Marinitoga aeolica TaxID=2809031 RepID=A0ABY8PRS4_9BACT|nr:DUF996 domain-containing protein [Marinitoga aeolica]WGS65322.1 DUF996 domain-containing protein [Marinitoga aeolica]
MNLKNAKIMAGVGAILELAGHFGLIGFILELIGIYKISETVKDKRIFNYILWPGIIIFIIYIGGFLIFTGSFFYSSPNMMFNNDEFFYETGHRFPNMFLMFIGFIVSLILPIIYQIKAYTLLGDYFGNDYFYKSAKFLKWGLILSIIIVGLLLIFIAEIFKIIGYFTLPDEYKLEKEGEEEWRVKNY